MKNRSKLVGAEGSDQDRCSRGILHPLVLLTTKDDEGNCLLMTCYPGKQTSVHCEVEKAKKRYF